MYIWITLLFLGDTLMLNFCEQISDQKTIRTTY